MQHLIHHPDQEYLEMFDAFCENSIFGDDKKLVFSSTIAASFFDTYPQLHTVAECLLYETDDLSLQMRYFYPLHPVTIERILPGISDLRFLREQAILADLDPNTRELIKQRLRELL